MDSYKVIIRGEKVYAPASVVIDLRAQLAESERRRVELVEAVRPVLAAWVMGVRAEQSESFDALAALIGEEVR